MTPRNLFNLSVQTASVAVMSTGMVFVIVTRNIDLSVGALLGFIGMVMGTLQLNILPEYLGFGHWSIWMITAVAGLILGTIIGAFQGWIIGYLTVPAFIVTLGGLLVWRGAAWWVTQGQTVAPLNTHVPHAWRRRRGNTWCTAQLAGRDIRNNCCRRDNGIGKTAKIEPRIQS